MAKVSFIVLFVLLIVLNVLWWGSDPTESGSERRRPAEPERADPVAFGDHL